MNDLLPLWSVAQMREACRRLRVEMKLEWSICSHMWYRTWHSLSEQGSYTDHMYCWEASPVLYVCVQVPTCLTMIVGLLINYLFCADAVCAVLTFLLLSPVSTSRLLPLHNYYGSRKEAGEEVSAAAAVTPSRKWKTTTKNRDVRRYRKKRPYIYTYLWQQQQ